uniref:Putative secreted protein n=1 Tax=Anopheles darlingi TaxID=43151 RepID=A0A2M4D9Q7_ANODA
MAWMSLLLLRVSATLEAALVVVVAFCFAFDLLSPDFLPVRALRFTNPPLPLLSSFRFGAGAGFFFEETLNEEDCCPLLVAIDALATHETGFVPAADTPVASPSDGKAFVELTLGTIT